MSDVLKHFQKQDPILGRVAVQVWPVELRKSTNYFSDLCASIVQQQLSEKAGSTIWKRFEDLFPDREVLPELVATQNEEQLRAVGVSGAKTRYIKNLADAVLSRTIELETVNQLDDQEVIKYLTQLKGIGPWTAEMFLMFTLGREDVFSSGDLGLKRAIERLYGIKDPIQLELDRITSIWSPYRSYASLILWRSLELEVKP